MTLEALADRTAGLLLVGIEDTAVSGATAPFIAGTAGVILFRRNIEGRSQASRLVASVQAAAGQGEAPLLVAVDQEGGTVERLGLAGTPPPSAMSLGSADDPALTRSIYRMIGDELRELGVNVNLAPVADVLTEPRGPLGLRSFGADPQLVAHHVVAAVEGLHDAGVAAAVKHFPGLGGALADSHLTLPTIERSRADVLEADLLPFRAAIDAGVDIVMSAHVAVPQIDASGEPATLSPALLTGLLREEMGFSGVICTDDLEMQAIAARYSPGDAAVRAIAAGADLVLFSRSMDSARAARDALRSALLSGALDARAVETSLERVTQLRTRLALERQRSTRAKLEDPHATLVREAAQRAIAVVRAAPGQLPLAGVSGARVFIVNFTEGGAQGASAARVHSPVGAALAAAGARVTEQLRGLDPAGHELKQLLMAAGSADVLIAVTRNAFRHPLQARAVSDLALFGKPPIVIAALEPFDADALPESAAVIASFGDGEAQLEAAADVLLGKRVASGHVPAPLTVGIDAP